MEGIWEALKEMIKEQLPPSTFDLWIEPLKAAAGPGGELFISCPNPFALRWVQSHYLKLIRQAMQTMENRLPVQLGLLPAPARPPALLQSVQPALPLLPDKSGGRALNRAFTFEQFVVGSSNRLAFQASRALAKNDTFYNRVLFLTSGTGLGKSHLSQAVGNFIGDSSPRRHILYLSAENFANEMVCALRNGRMSNFKERFRQECDILLLEEVQFLSGKEKIQAELCYTLDTLMSCRKRLVFTSCYLPGEISHLSQELRSRLTSGIITPIAPPDFPTRVEILTTKAETRGVQISAKILEYLAEYVTGDVRRLESALDCLIARATLLHESFSLPLAKQVLQDLNAVETRLSIPDIQKIVGNYYQVSLPDLLGRSRQKRLVRARQMALHFSRLYTEKTMVQLGRLFQRSHASVVHALQTLERDRKTIPRVAEELKLLEGKLAQAQVSQGSRRASTLHTDA